MNEAAFKSLDTQGDEDLKEAISATKKETEFPKKVAQIAPSAQIETQKIVDTNPKIMTPGQPNFQDNMNAYEQEQMDLIRTMSLKEEEERK